MTKDARRRAHAKRYAYVWVIEYLDEDVWVPWLEELFLTRYRARAEVKSPLMPRWRRMRVSKYRSGVK